MANNLTAAQQTQLENRDSTGQWKQKAHGQAADAAAALGIDDRSRDYVLPGHAGEGTVMPTAAAESLTSPEERQRLEEWYSKMSRHHGVKAAHARLDITDEASGDISAARRRELTDRHDLHAARAAAYRLPPNATRAKLVDGEVTAVYDRDGEGRAFSGVRMKTVDGYDADWVDEAETESRDGAVILDLDIVKGCDAGGENDRQPPEPQRRITMRPVAAGDPITAGDQLYLDAADSEFSSRHGEVFAIDGGSVLLHDDEAQVWTLPRPSVRSGDVWTDNQATLIDPDEPPA